MANFFSDNKDLQFHLQHPMMRKIVELKERGFAEKDLYDYAPQDFDDAMDSYRCSKSPARSAARSLLRMPRASTTKVPAW
jgi:hypothetical protein